MAHMQMYIYDKGATYSADCSRCGATHIIHEWTTDAFAGDRDAMREGALRCDHCGGTMDPDTFHAGRRMYAGRYSAPGYLDCTDWHYHANLRTLTAELRDAYADE